MVTPVKAFDSISATFQHQVAQSSDALCRCMPFAPIDPKSYTRKPPYTPTPLNPKPQTQNPKPATLKPKPYTLTQNPQPSNPEPSTGLAAAREIRLRPRCRPRPARDHRVRPLGVLGCRVHEIQGLGKNKDFWGSLGPNL